MRLIFEAAILAILLIFAASSAGGAEQLFRFDDSTSYPPLLESVRPASCDPVSVPLPEYVRTPGFARFDAVHSTPLFPKEALRLSGWTRFHGRPLLSLLNRRLPSRYNSGAYASVHAGYGDVLWEDKVGRVRMNGAGIQDPDALYVKLEIKF